MLGKIVAIIALLALPFSVTLWVKSHNTPEHHRYDLTVYKSLRVYLRDGVCALRVLNLPTRTASKTEFHSDLTYDPAPGKRQFLLQAEQRGDYRVTWLVFPLWLPTTILGLLFFVPTAYGPVRRWRRKLKGWCLECGYDLQGSRSSRCPECGLHF